VRTARCKIIRWNGVRDVYDNYWCIKKYGGTNVVVNVMNPVFFGIRKLLLKLAL
jgi:hypothetical protein